MITILVPLYNGIEYLSDSIKSVISQSFQEWKLFIGVNGHGDNSRVIADKVIEIVGSDTRIRVFIQPPDINNKAKSLNDLIKQVTTEWVALLDADDTWLPGKLQDQVNIINTGVYEVIGTRCVYFGSRGGSPSIPLRILPRGCTLNGNPLINSSVVLKSKHAKWLETAKVHIDYELWLRLDLERVKMYNIPKVLVRHRIYNSSFFNSQKANPTLLKKKFAKLFKDG